MSSHHLNLKEKRESKHLSISFIASKLGLAESVLKNLEEANPSDETYPLKVKISYVKRYAEFLEFSAKEINNELVDLTAKYNKKQSKGRLTWFDYLNRLVILILFCVLLYSVYLLYLENKMLQNQNLNNDSILILEPNEYSTPVVEEITITPTNQNDSSSEIVKIYQAELITPDDNDSTINEMTVSQPPTQSKDQSAIIKTKPIEGAILN